MMSFAIERNRILASFAGEKPPSPKWFDWALSQRPETCGVISEGSAIEYLAWGDRGLPGLMLLHGGGANCWWWSHIAPFFAETHRVAAMSMAGMGGSEWRDSYSVEQHARDMEAVAKDAGLFAHGNPTVVGHSFGGAPTAVAVSDPEPWVDYAIVIDSSLDMGHQPSSDNFKPRERRYFESLEQGLARYYFIPSSDGENAYVADMIARHSIVEVEGEGWSWSFDPNNYAYTERADSRAHAKASHCPLAIIYGDRSPFMQGELIEGMKADLADGTPFISIPDSGHHIMVDQPLALVAAMRSLIEARKTTR